jgi:hypothetical protein
MAIGLMPETLTGRMQPADCRTSDFPAIRFHFLLVRTSQPREGSVATLFGLLAVAVANIRIQTENYSSPTAGRPLTYSDPVS